MPLEGSSSKEGGFMWEIIKRYWQVFLLKETPANTPHSLFLFACVTITYWILLILQWSLVDIKESFVITHPVLASFTVLLSYCLYTAILLKLFNKTSRFIQTMTTLIVSNLFIHLLAYPLLFMTSTLDLQEVAGPGLFVFAIFYLLFTLLLSTWQFLVTVHIYKLSLELDTLKAIMVSVGMLACNILTVSLWR